MANDKKTIFISYSHSDKEWLDRLWIYLKPLTRKYNLDIWDDNRIRPGEKWREKLDEAIESADIAVLLVSHHFMASDFIHNNELPPLLDAAEKRGVKIISLILRPCQYHTHVISKYQAINDASEPLNKLNQGEQDTVLLELTDEIERLLNVPVELYTEIPIVTNDWRALVFDIDGTLLFADEDLGINDKRCVTNQLAELVSNGFRLVFITGNDYELQKKRVLTPLIGRGIAHAVTCFSDGGSRVFNFNSGEFRENIDYSKDHLFSKEEVAEIDQLISVLLDEFLSENPALRTPDISLYRHEKKRLDLLISPIRPSFCRQSLGNFRKQIENTLSTIEMGSDCSTVDSMVPNGLIVRLSGIYAFVDSFMVQNSLQDLFHTNYQGISDPELQMRGGLGYICQLSLKPFKRNDLRTQFLNRIRERLPRSAIDERLIVLLGGKTTIDIQRKNVNKAKAVLHLVTTYGYKPENLMYFGDEFILHGNDLPVAEMDASVRPKIILHVGDKDRTPVHLKRLDGFLIDGNGPIGTQNYLKLLTNEIAFH